jgi:hypothetical protein
MMSAVRLTVATLFIAALPLASSVAAPHVFDALVDPLKMKGRVFAAFLTSSPAIDSLSPSRR